MMTIANRKFSMLTVLDVHSKVSRPSGSVTMWRCLCECGQETVVSSSNLYSGNTKSCGCLKKKAGDRTRTHGRSHSKVHQLWAAMIQRAKGNRAQSYVARGITVCERWKTFENFLADMGDPPAPGYSLERVDNDRGYEPGNCRWLPMSEQWRNRANTNLWDYAGERLSLREIADRCGVKHPTLRHRIKSQGLSLDEAIKKGAPS